MACLLTACGSQGTKSDPATEGTAGDSVVFALDNELLTSRIRTEVPQQSLALAVGEWLDEALGGYYDGDARDMKTMVDFYGRAISDTLAANARSMMEDGMQPYAKMGFEAEMTKLYETDAFVTYALSTYYDLGGAHPSSGYEGATFRKSDGRRLSWDIVRHYMRYSLNEVLKKSLMGYFGVQTDEELEETLQVQGISVYSIPLPAAPPYFLENGVAYTYQQYEIVSYAMGMPSDVIPYDQMEPLLTGWAKRLIPQTKVQP